MKTIRKRNNVTTSFPIDLSNMKFGLLTVLEISERRKGRKTWKCICECGKEHLVYDINLKRGMVTSCGCNHYKKGKDHLQFNGYEDISGKRWAAIILGAKNRNIEFSITKEQVWNLFLLQNKKCALTNIPICFLDKTASVDRIDSSKGYTVNNIQVVHWHVNKMKMDFEQEYFIKMCKLITKNNERRN